MDTKKTVTIYDIAREARVSPATVSRILTGSAKVNLEKRKRVLELIQRYDFHPNNAARSLTEKRSHTLGIICPDVRNPYYASLFAECERLAYAHGYMLMLNNSFGDPNLETTFVSRMLEQRCESIIMAGGVTDWVKLPEDYRSTLQRVARAGAVDLHRTCGTGSLLSDHHQSGRGRLSVACPFGGIGSSPHRFSVRADQLLSKRRTPGSLLYAYAGNGARTSPRISNRGL